MHPLAREAEFQLRLLLESYSDSARIPPLLQVSIHRDDARDNVRFTVRFADGRQCWFACDAVTLMMAPRQWRSTREIVHILAGLWDGMRSERREPPRMLAPPTDEALRDELLYPGPIEWYRGELHGMTFRDDRRPRRGRHPQPDMNVINELMRQRDMALDSSFYGGLAGGAMTTSNAASPGAAGLTMETMQRAMAQMSEASAVPPRYMYEGRPFLDRCRCPACSDPERQRDRARAGTKSLTLLKEWLSPTQLAQYDKSGYFEVTSSSGKRYQIRHGIQGNVLELDESGTKVVASLCFQPQGEAGWFPGDTMLAQKIMLENDEAAALKAANVNRSLPWPLPVEWVPAR
jgi:hypothetical protein